MDGTLEKIRHSASHVLAIAVKKLYPNIKLGIGPAIEEGFYYDFDNLSIKDENLKKISALLKNVQDDLENVNLDDIPEERRSIKMVELFIEKERYQDIKFHLYMLPIFLQNPQPIFP